LPEFNGMDQGHGGFRRGAEDDPIGAGIRRLHDLAVHRPYFFPGVGELSLARANHRQQAGSVVECLPRSG